MSDGAKAGTSGGSWREQAVARSLDTARARAEDRVQRFLDAALEVMEEPGSDGDFTVSEIVERSGQSLRSFYQYFGGKHELLLALFEESVVAAAATLRDQLAGIDDPLERLHTFVVGYYRLCNPAAARPSARGRGGATPTTPVLVEFAQRLLTEHPVEAAQAFAPIVTLFSEVVGDAAQAGVVRPGLARSPLTGVILQAIMFNAFSATIGGSGPARGGDLAEEFWTFVLDGVGADDG